MQGTSFQAMGREMVQNDYTLAKRDKLCNDHGNDVYSLHGGTRPAHLQQILYAHQREGCMSEIVTFEEETRPVDVRLEDETFGATQTQMADLFGTTPENILTYLKNVYQDEELSELASSKDLLL